MLAFTCTVIYLKCLTYFSFVVFTHNYFGSSPHLGLEKPILVHGNSCFCDLLVVGNRLRKDLGRTFRSAELGT